MKHDSRGVLSMANRGPNTNSSQFFVTLGKFPHLDGRHVVFGKLIGGWETLHLLEGEGTKSGKTLAPATITACGVMSEDDAAKVAEQDKWDTNERVRQTPKKDDVNRASGPVGSHMHKE